MRLVVITAPDPIIDVAGVKSLLGITGTSQDTLLGILTAAACAQIEPPLGWTGRAFGQQTLELRADDWPDDDGLRLLAPPIVSISSVKYVDTAGTEQTVSSGDYELLGDTLSLAYGSAWPDFLAGSEAIRVRYVAGYDPDDPQLGPAKSAVALMVKAQLSLGTRDPHLSQENVPGVGSRNYVFSDMASRVSDQAVQSLLQPYRVYS
jgi:uncharacterized phiE125 gp8 family phage protein